MGLARRVRIGAAVGVTLVALSVGACGRRGRLEPPPDPNAPPRSDMTKQGLHRRPRNPPITAPKEPFILDPLL